MGSITIKELTLITEQLNKQIATQAGTITALNNEILNLKSKNSELGNMYAGSLEVYLNQTVIIDSKNWEIKKLKDELTYLKGFEKKEPVTQTFDKRTFHIISREYINENESTIKYKSKPTPPQSQIIKEGHDPIPSVPKSERYNIEEDNIGTRYSKEKLIVDDNKLASLIKEIIDEVDKLGDDTKFSFTYNKQRNWFQRLFNL